MIIIIIIIIIIMSKRIHGKIKCMCHVAYKKV